MIDPLSQMKREYNTILDDADSANRINFVPPQSFTPAANHARTDFRYLSPVLDKEL